MLLVVPWSATFTRSHSGIISHVMTRSEEGGFRIPRFSEVAAQRLAFFSCALWSLNGDWQLLDWIRKIFVVRLDGETGVRRALYHSRDSNVSVTTHSLWLGVWGWSWSIRFSCAVFISFQRFLTFTCDPTALYFSYALFIIGFPVNTAANFGCKIISFDLCYGVLQIRLR